MYTIIYHQHDLNLTKWFGGRKKTVKSISRYPEENYFVLYNRNINIQPHMDSIIQLPPARFESNKMVWRNKKNC